MLSRGVNLALGLRGVEAALSSIKSTLEIKIEAYGAWERQYPPGQQEALRLRKNK